MNPRNADSDNDGLKDGEEDANHNGITDGGETNPCSADTDRDGLPDGWERQYQLNPLDPRDSTEDSDRDGLTNTEEFVRKPILARQILTTMVSMMAVKSKGLIELHQSKQILIMMVLLTAMKIPTTMAVPNQEKPIPLSLIATMTDYLTV
jgi:hypothetical protein